MSSSYLCPQVPGISWKQVENIAEYIRGTIYSEPSKVIQRGACLRLFEGGLRIFGIEYAVQELALGEEGFYDSQWRELILSPESYEGLLEDKGRSRFTLAHELGHSQLHGKFIQSVMQGRTSCPTLKRSQIPAYADPECQANVFASAFLMPKQLFLTRMREGLTVDELAKVFLVSRDAARIRYTTLQKQASSANY